MKRLLLLICIFFMFLQNSFAQEFSISKTNFLPKEFYVGDFVELELIIRTADREKIKIPEVLPNEDWVEFESDIRVIDHPEGARIKIVFRSFYPGIRTLPALDFDVFTISSVKIKTESILSDPSEAGTGFAAPREQMYLPGTQVIIIILVFVFLVIPMFLLFLAGRLKKWLKKTMAQQREKKPIKRFFRTLDDLKKQAGRISSREFYIELTLAVRKYLSIRSGKDYQTITTKEIDTQIEINFAGIYHLHDLVEVLKYGDEIKFSPRRSSYYKEIRDIELIVKVVTAIEDTVSGKKGRDELSITLEKEDME